MEAALALHQGMARHLVDELLQQEICGLTSFLPFIQTLLAKQAEGVTSKVKQPLQQLISQNKAIRLLSTSSPRLRSSMNSASKIPSSFVMKGTCQNIAVFSLSVLTCCTCLMKALPGRAGMTICTVRPTSSRSHCTVHTAEPRCNCQSYFEV